MDEHEGLSILCPYCAGKIGSYGDRIECFGEDWCAAEWHSDGDLIVLPRYVRTPEKYSRPKV